MEKKPIFYHFIIDDIFIPDSIKCFEKALLTNNQYFFISDDPEYKLRFYNDKISIISKDCAKEMLTDSNSCDVVVLHSLYSIPHEILPSIKRDIKVLWYAWGFDLYNNPLPGWPLIKLRNELLPKTKYLIEKLYWKEQLKKHAKHYIKLIAKPNYKRDNLKHVLSRIDYFAGVFEEEYYMLKERYDYFNAQRIVHNYIHPQEFVKDDLDSPINITGNNILLGNSAVYLCNHIDVLHTLKEKIGNQELNCDIICPLSYAGKPEYIECVKKEGKLLFGDKFRALVDFLPLDEYQKIVNSCSIIILGHIRQAATCNCLSSIWSGLRLYEPKTSMNYQHYKTEGIQVASLEELSLDSLNLAPNLIETAKNRQIIENIYSFRQWVEDLQDSLRLMNLSNVNN